MSLPRSIGGTERPQLCGWLSLLKVCPPCSFPAAHVPGLGPHSWQDSVQSSLTSPPRSLFILDVTFPACLLPSDVIPAVQEPYAVAGASPFPSGELCPASHAVVGMINPALEAFFVAFEQIFQRVGQFQGHASQRTVGTCPCPLGRVLVFTSSSRLALCP